MDSTTLGRWGRACALPWVVLLALAPAVRHSVGPSGAAVFVVLAHLHAVLVALAFWPCLCIGGLDHQGEALEHRVQPCQQPAFVTVAQGQLHLAASNAEVDVDTRWRFREWRGGCWRRSLRWCEVAGPCSLAIGSRVGPAAVCPHHTGAIAPAAAVLHCPR
jgi:hypothetical protein